MDFESRVNQILEDYDSVQIKPWGDKYAIKVGTTFWGGITPIGYDGGFTIWSKSGSFKHWARSYGEAVDLARQAIRQGY